MSCVLIEQDPNEIQHVAGPFESRRKAAQAARRRIDTHCDSTPKEDDPFDFLDVYHENTPPITYTIEPLEPRGSAEYRLYFEVDERTAVRSMPLASDQEARDQATDFMVARGLYRIDRIRGLQSQTIWHKEES
ncbi:MAG: hypothetical protein ABEN55_21065 [Bradymonadaceae bacterium]